MMIIMIKDFIFEIFVNYYLKIYLITYYKYLIENKNKKI